jgi:Putative metallopeptidase
MKFCPALLGAGMLAGAIALPSMALAQRSSALQNSKIEILYEAPTDSKFEGVRDRLKQRGVLEDVSQFLAPLRLPKPLTIATRQCGVINAFYRRGQGVTICYEYVDKMEAVAPAVRTAEGVSRASAITGAVVQVLMHELGHATFDILDAPVFGREEDAADQMSAFIVVQFGKDVARWLVTGGIHYYSLGRGDRQFYQSEFSDEHGTDAQRFYNMLCIGYGADPTTFQDFVDKGLLPQARARNCAHEYQQVRRAFLGTVMPFVDEKLVKIVQATEWLRPEDVR